MAYSTYVLLTAFAVASTVCGRDNILFIVSDDMRPELEPYGSTQVKTPNFQALADSGVVFQRNYVQQALCSPSRTVFLTSKRPDSSRVWAIGPYFRDTTGRDFVTLPQFFKENGYVAAGTGKVFHTGEASGLIVKNGTIIRHGDDYPASWSQPYNQPSDPYNHWPKGSNHSKGAPNAYMAVDQPWQTFSDGQSTTWAVRWLENYTHAQTQSDTANDKPFFLAVGYHRPHIPYVYPKEFDIYNLSNVPFPPDNHRIPEGLPVCSMHDWSQEMSTYGDMKAAGLPLNIKGGFEANLSALCTVMPPEKGHEAKRAYWSALTYVDFLVGQLMSTVKSLGLWDNTTIVFLGDHGYKLGEACDWFKHDNKESATRIPTIVKPSKATAMAHGIDPSALAGTHIETVTEAIDIYPSLVDLHGFEVPTALQGQSWVPLLAGNSQSERVALSQYPHSCASLDGIKKCRLPSGELYSGPVMGYTIRSAHYRYTEWTVWGCKTVLQPMNCTDFAPQWDQIVAKELYDHTNDPSTQNFVEFEMANLHGQANYSDVEAAMAQLLHKHFAA